MADSGRFDRIEAQDLRLGDRIRERVTGDHYAEVEVLGLSFGAGIEPTLRRGMADRGHRIRERSVQIEGYRWIPGGVCGPATRLYAKDDFVSVIRREGGRV